MCSSQSEDESFILASQAQQVFYVKDPNEDNWSVVMKTIPRDLFDIQAEEVDGDDDLEVEPPRTHVMEDTYDDNIDWVREDVGGTTIEK
uniref:DUF4216 domain-containing protein n=1 Tax=Nelumbo nucifera TaxID=4432 RepID=A0A822YFE7_NELNU|nr:TPA_asm: hypothetical protein HUJ06_031427 [Nelumbo nucifera]